MPSDFFQMAWALAEGRVVRWIGLLRRLTFGFAAKNQVNLDAR